MSDQILLAIKEDSWSRIFKNDADLNGLLSSDYLADQHRSQILNILSDVLAEMPNQLKTLLSNTILSDDHHAQLLDIFLKNSLTSTPDTNKLQQFLSGASLTPRHRKYICDALPVEKLTALSVKDAFALFQDIVEAESLKPMKQEMTRSRETCGFFVAPKEIKATPSQLYLTLRLIEAQYERTGGGSSKDKLQTMIQDVVGTKSIEDAVQKIKPISFSGTRINTALETLLTQLNTTGKIDIDPVLKALITEKHTLRS